MNKATVNRRPGTVHALVRMDQTSSVCLRDCVAPLCVEKKGEEGGDGHFNDFGKDIIKSLRVFGKMMICFSFITLAHKISHFLQMQINACVGTRRA